MKIAKSYEYRDESGRLLYEAVRLDPKDFRQRQWTGTDWQWNLNGCRRVLYRLPFLLVEPEAIVWLCEGEKDADRLAAEGLCATTNVCGADAWRDEYGEALQGRRVVVVPDNDAAGEKRAKAVPMALRAFCEAVVVVRGPANMGKDVSDWLDAGMSVTELKALADKQFRDIQGFSKAAARLVGERQERLDMGSQALSFGVPFLDQSLGGILPRDLILVGAKTGLGKTALTTIIALDACRQGKRVHYFALEAEDREIERRMKFQILATEYYRSKLYPRPIRYIDWYMGRLDEEMAPYESYADEELGRALQNLNTFYRVNSFTGQDFLGHIERIKDGTDLVILDHLHYVDSTDDNENRAYKSIVKQIRDGAIRSGKPVILVAHIRKTDRRYDMLVPTLEDFHGSSDIAKIATKAIMLAPAYDIPGNEAHIWPTYMQIAKCRTDSSLTRYVALLMFDAHKNCYGEGYRLGKLIDAGKKFEALSAFDLPPWSRATNRLEAVP